MENKEVLDYLKKNLKIKIETVGYGRKTISLILENTLIDEAVFYED
jgi:hypothetical protein